LVKRPHGDSFEAEAVESEDIDAKIKPQVPRKLCDWDSGVQRIRHDLFCSVMEDNSTFQALRVTDC
jgi:hypothetical protein